MAKKKAPPSLNADEAVRAVATIVDHMESIVSSGARSLRDEVARMSERIEALADERDTLVTRVSNLEGEIEELADKATSEDDLAAVRDQLESLATDVDRSCAPQTPEQWRRCLRVIAAGGEWEVDGTWR